MKKLLYFLFVSAILLSCGANTEKLQFSAFEIKDENGITRIVVSKNGEIKVNGENIGLINTDGILQDKDGNLLAKLREDNFFQDQAGENLIKINKNGQMDNGSGMFVEWSATGELLKGNEQTGIHIEPNDSKSYQAASAILYLYLSFN